MSFTLSDQHIEDFHTLGYTVFEQILPATLIGLPPSLYPHPELGCGCDEWS